MAIDYSIFGGTWTAGGKAPPLPKTPYEQAKKDAETSILNPESQAYQEATSQSKGYMFLSTGGGSTRSGSVVQQPPAPSQPQVLDTGSGSQKQQQSARDYAKANYFVGNTQANWGSVAYSQMNPTQVVVYGYPELKDQKLNRSLSGFTKRSGGTIEINRKTELVGEKYPRERTTISARSSSSDYLATRMEQGEQFNRTGWTAAELLSGEKFITAPSLISYDTGSSYPSYLAYTKVPESPYEKLRYPFGTMGESRIGGLGTRKSAVEIKSSKFFDYLRFAGRELTMPRTIETPYDKPYEPVPFFTATPTRTTRTDITADTSLPTLYRTGVLNQRTIEPQLFSLQVEKKPNMFQQFTRYTEKLNTQDTDTRTLERIGINFARIPLGFASIVFVAPAKLGYSVVTDVTRGESKTIKGFINFGKDVVSGKAGYRFGEKLRTDSGFAAGEVIGTLYAPKIAGNTLNIAKNIYVSSKITKGASIGIGRYKTFNSYFRPNNPTYKYLWLKKGEIGKNAFVEGKFIPAKVFFKYGESRKLTSVKSLGESLNLFGKSRITNINAFERIKIVSREYSDIIKPFDVLSKSSREQGAYAWTNLDEAFTILVKSYKRESGVWVQTSTPKAFDSTISGIFGKAAKGKEEGGIYVSPLGEGMARFLRVESSKITYGLNPASLFSGFFDLPRVVMLKAKGVALPPLEQVSKAGFGLDVVGGKLVAVGKYEAEMARSGFVFITKRSLLGTGELVRQKFFNPVTKKWGWERGTRESEARVPVGTEFSLKNIKSYTFVAGKVVGIQKGNLIATDAAAFGLTIKNPLETPDSYAKDVFISTEGRGISSQFTGRNLMTGEKFATQQDIINTIQSSGTSMRQVRPVYSELGSFKRDAYGVAYSEVPSRTESPSLLTTYSGIAPSRTGRPTGYSVSASIAPYDLSSASYSFERSLGGSDVSRRGGGGSSSVVSPPSSSITGLPPSRITPSGYFPPYPPKSEVGIPPLAYFPPLFAHEQKYRKKKPLKTKEKSKIRAERTGVYVLPDLQAVFQTEAYNYLKFGKGEAVAPRLTKGIYSSALIAFKGYGVGFIPTEQMRTGRIKL